MITNVVSLSSGTGIVGLNSFVIGSRDFVIIVIVITLFDCISKVETKLKKRNRRKKANSFDPLIGKSTETGISAAMSIRNRLTINRLCELESIL